MIPKISVWSPTVWETISTYHPELPLLFLTCECICKQVSVHVTDGKGTYMHENSLLVSLREIS